MIFSDMHVYVLVCVSSLTPLSFMASVFCTVILDHFKSRVKQQKSSKHGVTNFWRFLRSISGSFLVRLYCLLYV